MHLGCTRKEKLDAFRWDQRLQNTKENFSWPLKGFPDGGNIGSIV